MSHFPHLRKYPTSWICLLGLAGLLACGGLHAHAHSPAEPPRRFEVNRTADLLYYEVVKDPDPYRHQLDVYSPRGEGPFPVLFLLHGGGWVIGQKDDYFGYYGYGTIARCLAEQGVVVVLPNYRLSPAVRHPEHVKDAARAFAWTAQNVRRYGGDPGKIFLVGQSAGGHMAALLATDDKYLREVGRSRSDLQGVIGLSGVYRVEDLYLNMSLAGPGGAKVMESGLRPFAAVFGEDPKVARDASPLSHVGPGLPPFLLINAGLDYPRSPEMARDFASALKKNGCTVKEATVPWRTHETLLFDIPRRSVEPVTMKLIVEFVREHSAELAPQGVGKKP